MIKAVLIDVDNTLLDFEKCAKYSMTMASRDFNILYTDQMMKTFTEVNDGLWLKIEKNTLTKDELHKIRWNLIFDRLNVDFDGVKFEAQFRYYLNQSAETVDGAKELMQYLHGKYFVGTASNGAHEQQKRRLSLANLSPYVNEFFASSEIGFEKPAYGFFDYCFKHCPVNSPEEVIVVGDSLTADIIGGINYKMKTCWFDFRKYGDDKGLNIDYKIKSLKELKKIL